ncbi:translocation/assembly module TamB domain-containing protein [Shewanella sp. MMG014]|uniref:autotransporter assembly complex protein TamB n=1 Tax=Shewanella sp. MMG014 TaxID=2822691 RepID=UPI001B35EC8B|nr:translocation/assembly module TamB domain-containing protein [Shewanella sp. MMG014]MBQ4891750.1 translocation/assembly module TamB domain-containing protein [Shewanella sp. MMG014]
MTDSMPPKTEDSNQHDSSSLAHIPASKPPKSFLGRCWQAFKLCTRTAIYIPLLLLMLIAILIGTPIGAQISVMLANQFVPNLALNLKSGTINNQLEFTTARWSMDGVAVEVEGLSLSWVPTCLFNKQICVDNFFADDVTVIVQTDQFADDEPSKPSENDNAKDTNNEDAAEQQSPSPLILPVTIGLNQLDLNDVKVTVNDMRYNAGRLQGKALWNKSGLRVNYLHSEGLLVDIPLGESSQQDTADTQATSSPNNQDKNVSSSELETWAMANLPAVYMTFPIYVDELITHDSVMKLGNRTDHFSHISLTGSYVEYLIDVQALSVSHDYGEASLVGDISLNHDYPMNIDAKFNLSKVTEAPDFTQQKIAIEAENGFDNLSLLVSATGDVDIDFEAIIELSKPEMDYQIEIAQANINWPLDKPDYTARLSKLTSKGNIHQQSAIFSGEFLSPYHPLLMLDANIELSQNELIISHLDVESEAGNLVADGNLNFDDKVSWSAQLATSSLQLDKVPYLYELTELASNIDGSLLSAGVIDDEQWQITIEDADLSGTLNDFPLTVKGNIEFNDKFAINADNLQASALGAELLINGQASRFWDVDAELSVPDVSQWLPNAKGEIYAKIDVTGDDTQPIVDVSGRVSNVKFADIDIEQLTLKGHYLPLNEHQFTLSINNNQLSWQQIDLSGLTLSAEGTLAEQKIKLNTQGDIALNTQINNQFNEQKQTFNTDINSLVISNLLGAWQINNPVNIQWDQLNQEGQITPFCLIQTHSSLCLNQQGRFGTQGDLSLSINGQPGNLLQPLLPPRLNWTGESDLEATAQWSETDKLKANIALLLNGGDIALRRTENDRINLHYDTIKLDAVIDETQLKSSLIVSAENIAEINSQISISNDEERALTGFIKADTINIGPLRGFFPKLATLEGLFAADLSILGNLTQPEVQGSLSLENGALATTNNPTLIDDITLAMQLKGQQAKVDGTLAMGDGKASVAGTLAWPDGRFSGDIDILGDKLAFIQPPIAILDISPDINITFDTTQLAIKGNVDIPTGEITVVQLAEGGVAVSSDVVFNDSISEKEQQTSPYAVVSDLNIKVGNELLIDGMGLSGKLRGTLLLQQQAFKPPLLFGDIKVTNGSYKFMGQTLTISTGEVQFSGPTEVPNLNIEAVREIKDEDLTAGVRVTGTAMQPEVTLFSSPAKEQAEILSYIITGAGFSNSSNEQNNALMMGAALSLGSQLGGGAINNIGSTATGLIEKFGFSNVQLDANDEGRFAISGYIGEDLMVKYGIGVFNPGYEMTVRYYILSQLYLETVSGTINQSLDIYYSFNVD